MRFEMEPSQDLGLQHTLKNGVAILSGAHFDAGRREKVLNGLLEIVREADKGSEALQNQSFTFARDEGAAFERFSLFLRYLGDTVADIGQRLSSAKDVIEGVGAGVNVDQGEREAVVNLLTQLIDALERDRNLAPLAAPREFHFN